MNTEIWSNTGLMPAVKHLALTLGKEAASKRLLATYQRNRRAAERYSNAVVRHVIRTKIANGHAHLSRDFGGIPYVSLDFGAGKGSSSFVRK